MQLDVESRQPRDGGSRTFLEDKGMQGGVASGAHQENQMLVREDGPRNVDAVALDELEGHAVRVTLVQLNPRGADHHNKLILENPVKTDNLSVIVLEWERAFGAALGEYVHKLDARLSALYRQDARGPGGKFDGRNRPPCGDSDLETVLLSHALHAHVREAVLHAEHLEVALVEERALNLLQRVEIHGQLREFQIVRTPRHFSLRGRPRLLSTQQSTSQL